MLLASDRRHLEKLAQIHELHIYKDWSEECTHIVTPGDTLSQKQVLGIAKGIPVVSMEWVKALEQVDDTAFELPDPNLYLVFATFILA